MLSDTSQTFIHTNILNFSQYAFLHLIKHGHAPQCDPQRTVNIVPRMQMNKAQ